MSGSVSTGSLVIGEDSEFLGNLTDVVITSVSHDNTIKYDSTNWVNSTISLNDLSDTNLNSLSHNDVLIWNETTGQWQNGKLTSLLTELEAVVNGVVSIKLSIYVGREIGDSAKSLCVTFTDETEGGASLIMASCGDNNPIYKKESTETSFSFLVTLNLGETYTDNLPAGTVFRSDHGIAGASDPFPTPFGLSCLADTYFRFFAYRNNVYVYATSAGRDSLVTLYASDETTIVDGPVFISAYDSTTLSCNANTEFVVVSTTDVFCGTGASPSNTNTSGNNSLVDVRLIPPLKCEIIVHNRANRLTARFTNTTVTWYKRDMTQGTVVVNAGTPLYIAALVAGNETAFGIDGWLILRSDKPISSFCGADGAGSNATEGWPIDFLAQLFPIYSTINGSTDNYARASINIASPYEGTASIYDSSRTLVHTFQYVRGTSPPVTVEDQLYPASGQSNPLVDGYSELQGGWVETTTPCVCVINFDGSSTFTTDNGDETTIPGTTPAYLKAQIRKDGNGFLRRRDIDVNGNETWNLC